MSRLYDRKIELLVGAAGGKAISFTDFRITFEILRGDTSTPNGCDVSIFNLSEATATRLLNEREFSRIDLSAGYMNGPFGRIFSGNIKQVRRGRVDQRDSYVSITAADGDEIYNFATIARSFSAGSKPDDSVGAFLESMATAAAADRLSVSGYKPDLSANGAVRGVVHFGSLKDELREFAEQNDCTVSIQDGKLVIIPNTSFIPGQVPTISAQTGLIGVPEQTANGIEMTVLLNPHLKIGQVVKLDATVNQYRSGLDFESTAQNIALQNQIKLNGAGHYYVMRAEHAGDTRGGNWYTRLTCLAVDATISPKAVPSGAVLPSDAVRRY